MGLEIEHKWLPEESLIREIMKRSKPVGIEQAYLCRKPVVRVRKDGDRYYLTYKGDGTLVRTEENLPLNREAFESLKAKREGNIIIKDRYRLPFSDLYPDHACVKNVPRDVLYLELDVFHGREEGLVLLEVEFPDLNSAESFQAPVEFGTDVTENPNYTNAVLSL